MSRPQGAGSASTALTYAALPPEVYMANRSYRPNQQAPESTSPTQATHLHLSGPATSVDHARIVRPRPGAIVDPAVIRASEDAAVKHNTFPSSPGRPSGRVHWQTHLHVEAWVRNSTYAKHLWVDVHVFGHDGALVARHTLDLVYERPAGDGGDVFRLDAVMYDGATASPGSSEPRADVRLVQYRLYGELDGRILTDGLLHECELLSDVVSS